MSTAKDWVYPNERTLGSITLVLGVLVWMLLIVGTAGVALVGLLLGYVVYLFTHSALIAHLKGNGVELTAEQFPDLHAQFLECCERLEIKSLPQAYVLEGGGMLNAFATQFLGHRYVVLLSAVIDSMDKHPDSVRFYIGHELGHLRMKHLTGVLLRLPVLWLPLLGAAYARARESTCDRHGLACSSSRENAVRALAALSAGHQRWQQLDVAAYCRQVRHSSGFWMSLHELTGGYPWLTKRAARLARVKVPNRNPLAYLLAVFLPYSGRLGAGFGLLMVVYVIGVLAAIALPAYKDYTTKAKFMSAYTLSEPVRQGMLQRYRETGQIPESLAAAGLPQSGSDGASYALEPKGMVLTVTTKEGELVFTPKQTKDGEIHWECTSSARQAALPKGCTADEPQFRH